MKRAIPAALLLLVLLISCAAAEAGVTLPVDLIRGYVHDGNGAVIIRQDGYVTGSACMERIVPVYAGSVLTKPEGIAGRVFFYDADGSFRGESEYIGAGATEYAFRQDGFMRLRLSKDAGELTLLELEQLRAACTLTHPSGCYAALPAVITQTKTGETLAQGFAGQGLQDGVIIGNELWMFAPNDAQNGTAPVYVFDKASGERLADRAHALGHANTVSYQRESDTLLTVSPVRDGEGKVTGNRLYLYSHPAAHAALLPEDGDCLCIEWDGVAAEGCAVWRTATTAYFIVQEQARESILLLELGTGTQDLSGDAQGFGAYREAAEGAFNGTLRVLQRYRGEPFGVCQGADFDGHLFIGGPNHDVLGAWEIALDDRAGRYEVVAVYQYDHPTADNPLVPRKLETETLVRDGGALYLAALAFGELEGSVLMRMELGGASRDAQAPELTFDSLSDALREELAEYVLARVGAEGGRALPYARRVHALTSDEENAPYILTNIGSGYRTGSLRVEIKCALGEVDTGATLLGCRTSMLENRYQLTTQNQRLFYYNSTGTGSVNMPSDGEPQIYIMTGEGLQKGGAGSVQRLEEPGDFELPCSIALFGCHSDGEINNQSGTRTIYYVKIWNGDELIADFVPVEDELGEGCMYERVSGELYYSGNGAPFTVVE